MNNTLKNPMTITWAVLVGITLLTWLLSQQSGAAFEKNQLITIGVLLVAALKCHLVIIQFMEVKHAPSWLRLSCAAWLSLIVLLCIGIPYIL